MVKDRLRNFFETAPCTNHALAAKLGDGDPLLESGVIDSLGLVQLVSYIERSFQVEIGPEDLTRENFSTLDGISELIRQKRAVPTP